MSFLFGSAPTYVSPNNEASERVTKEQWDLLKNEIYPKYVQPSLQASAKTQREISGLTPGLLRFLSNGGVNTSGLVKAPTLKPKGSENVAAPAATTQTPAAPAAAKPAAAPSNPQPLPKTYTSADFTNAIKADPDFKKYWGTDTSKATATDIGNYIEGVAGGDEPGDIAKLRATPGFAEWIQSDMPSKFAKVTLKDGKTKAFEATAPATTGTTPPATGGTTPPATGGTTTAPAPGGTTSDPYASFKQADGSYAYTDNGQTYYVPANWKESGKGFYETASTTVPGDTDVSGFDPANFLTGDIQAPELKLSEYDPSKIPGGISASNYKTGKIDTAVPDWQKTGSAFANALKNVRDLDVAKTAKNAAYGTGANMRSRNIDSSSLAAALSPQIQAWKESEIARQTAASLPAQFAQEAALRAEGRGATEAENQRILQDASLANTLAQQMQDAYWKRQGYADARVGQENTYGWQRTSLDAANRENKQKSMWDVMNYLGAQGQFAVSPYAHSDALSKVASQYGSLGQSDISNYWSGQNANNSLSGAFGSVLGSALGSPWLGSAFGFGKKAGG